MSDASVTMHTALSNLFHEIEKRADGLPLDDSDLAHAIADAREVLRLATRHEFYVVIVQNEMGKDFLLKHPDSELEDKGPLVWETQVNGATRPHAEAHAKMLGSAYGWTRVGRVIVEDWPGAIR